MKVGIGFFLVVISLYSSTALATVTEKKQALSEIQSQIKQVDSVIKTLGNEKIAQLEELKKIEKQYGELANNLIAIKLEVDQHLEKQTEIRNKINITQKDLQVQKHGLEGIVRSAHAIGDQEGLKLILNQHDPNLSGRMLVYLDYITKARIRKIQLIHENAQALQQLETEKISETQILQTALKKKQVQTEQMLMLKTQRESLLTLLNKDYLSKNDQKERLLRDERKLARLVASLQKTEDNDNHQESIPEPANPKPEQQTEIDRDSTQTIKRTNNQNQTNKSFIELQGALNWPVKGVISERFGSKRYDNALDGTVISTNEGAEIHAVAPGRVVYAEWMSGYGLLLIIDHGHNFMSLYGFNQSLYKKVGEQVDLGEKLASVGRSGGRSEASLYFGIRKNGKPINPELWCGKAIKN